jgi:hypothetical protein
LQRIEQKDEVDKFCESIAHSLRNLPQETRLKCQQNILKLLADANKNTTSKTISRKRPVSTLLTPYVLPQPEQSTDAVEAFLDKEESKMKSKRSKLFTMY